MSFLKLISTFFIFFSISLQARDYIIVQSTTSTANTGLLDILSERFFIQTGIEVRAVAVGTGTAIANAKKGDGDILIVHSKLDELNFIEEGFGVERFDLMYNDFIIVGPKNDPANISNKKDIADVMKQLASSKYKFISRDDNSGTHKKELLLWKIAGLQVPKDNSYLKTGSSMANAINVAAEMQAYLLTDRGTWISFKNKNNLKILFEKNESLFNPYGVIAINPKKFPHVEYQKSKKFINWLLNGEGKQLIRNYEVDNQQLFFTYN